MGKTAPLIRELRPEDLPALVLLEKECFADAWTEVMLFQQIGQEGSVYLVAVADDCVVGYIGGRVVLDEAELYRVAVLPQFRGAGYGDRLVRTFVDHCCERGAKNIFLEVREDNEIALQTYLSAGFQKISLRKNYYGNGVAAIIMNKSL